MQPNGMDPMQGMPPFEQQYTTPITPEMMQQWQQYGVPPQQFTPEMMQQWQQYGGAPPQQFTPEMMQQQITPEMFEQWQYQIYQMQQEQNAQAQQQGKKRSRQRRPRDPYRRGGFTRVMLVLATLCVLGGGAWFLWRGSMGAMPTTAVIEKGDLGTTHHGDALVVRSETAYEDEGVQSIEYVAQEGSLVYPGNVVCYVYSTGYNSKEMQTLQGYRDQIKNYQRTLLKSQTQLDARMDQLESEVIQRGLEVRSLVQGARGNLGNQETILARAITQRQNYFRSKNASDMRLSRLYGDEETQKQRIDSWIKQRHAVRQSIVSFYSDGFEQFLTLNDLDKYSPAEVRSMINGHRPEASTVSRGRTSIFRLVRPTDYAVLMLVKDTTWNPIEGATYTLSLEQFTNITTEAKVLSFSRSGGELLLRLAVMGDVTKVLYMRTCQASLGEFVDCMVVPASAIYEQNGAKGVVLTGGEKQLFVPVSIIQETDGRAYITALQTGVLSPGQSVRLFR